MVCVSGHGVARAPVAPVTRARFPARARVHTQMPPQGRGPMGPLWSRRKMLAGLATGHSSMVVGKKSSAPLQR
eukprot:14117788-Alexandrium_andersonii.AAC.1